MFNLPLFLGVAPIVADVAEKIEAIVEEIAGQPEVSSETQVEFVAEMAVVEPMAEVVEEPKADVISGLVVETVVEEVVGTAIEEVAAGEEVVPVVEVSAEEVSAPAETVAPQVDEPVAPVVEVAAPIEEAAPVEEVAIVEEVAAVAEAVVEVEEVAPVEEAPPVEEIAAVAEEVTPVVEEVAPVEEEHSAVVEVVEEATPVVEEVDIAVEAPAEVAEAVIEEAIAEAMGEPTTPVAEAEEAFVEILMSEVEVHEILPGILAYWNPCLLIMTDSCMILIFNGYLNPFLNLSYSADFLRLLPCCIITSLLILPYKKHLTTSCKTFFYFLIQSRI